MKILGIAVWVVSLGFSGCNTSVPSARRLEPATTSGSARAVEFNRGKALAWVPRATIHGVEVFDVPLLVDLQKNFIAPLTNSPFRFVIDHVEIDATSEASSEWQVEVRLDTGAKVELTGSNEFYDATGNSRFDEGCARVIAALQAEGRRDLALRTYLREQGGK